MHSMISEAFSGTFMLSSVSIFVNVLSFLSDFQHYYLPEFVYISVSLMLLLVYLFFVAAPVGSLRGLYKDFRVLLIFLDSFIVLHLVVLFLFVAFFFETSNTSFSLDFFEQLFINQRVLLFKFFLVLFSFFFFLLSRFVSKNFTFFVIDHYFLVVLSVSGGLLLLGSNDFLFFFLSLELLSMPLYVLAASNVSSNYSTEAGLKYLVMGATSSAFILFGLSFFYGSSGASSFSDLSLFFDDNFYSVVNLPYTGFAAFSDLALVQADVFLLFGVIFFFFGFCLKMGLAPLHFWMPDVYTGAPLNVTLFFMTIPKYITWVFLFDLVYYRLSLFVSDKFLYFFGALIVSNIVLGVFPALYQYKLKKLFIYSSIGVNGFFLLTFMDGSFSSFYVFLLVYIFNTFGLFSFLLILKTHFNTFINKFSNITDSSKSLGVVFFFVGLLLLSVAGLPPSLGFIAKFSVYYSSFYYSSVFVVFAIVSSVIMSFYYFRIIRFLFVADNKSTQPLNVLLLDSLSKPFLHYFIVYLGLLNVFLLFYYKRLFFFFAAISVYSTSLQFIPLISLFY